MLLTFEQFFSQKNLPVRLFFTDSSRALKWHSHEFVEIAILFEGESVYENDFSREKIVKGDVVIIPPGGNHQYTEERNVSLMNIIFVFEDLIFPYQNICLHPGFSALFRIRPDYCRQMKFYPKLHLTDHQLEQVKKILIPAWENQEAELPGATLGVYGALLQVIPILLNAWDAAPQMQDRKIPAIISAAVAKMSSQYKRKLQIPQLAKDAGMSESSFARHFKAATGQTPVEYLLMLRLQDAAARIFNGSSISEAAYAAGFTDSNYFSRVFKQKYGVSPSKIGKYPK